MTDSQRTSSSLKQRLFHDLLPFVAKPGRYIGNEFNMIRKDPAAVAVRIALVFPDVYEVGMSYLGYPILYHLLNQQPHFYAERAFAPWMDMAAQMREKGVPLFSLETFSPLRDFDLIGFTLQYELNYTTILELIDLAGLPLRAAERQDGPLVVGGGPSVFNPEPVADFFDLFVIGDGEEAALELAATIALAKQNGWARGETLHHCVQIPGVYIPQYYQPISNEAGAFAGLEPLHAEAPRRIRSRIVSSLPPGNYSDRPLVPVITTTHDRVSLEIARGCSRGCRFCNAGMMYRPVRQRPVEDLTRQAVAGIRNTGYDEVSLVSLSTSDYEELGPLMQRLQAELGRKMVNISFPSLRPEKFTPEVARFAKGVRKSGLTLAPEAGSQRLREVINKTTTAADLLRAVELAFQEGWQVVKLYFMIGQPTETDADLQGMVDLIDQVVALARRWKGTRINISVSPFVPKPGTPFQWAAQDSPGETRRKLAFLRERLRDKRIKLSWRDAEVAQIEGVLARGDRRLGRVIERVWQAGTTLEGWSENFHYEIWLQALATEGLQPEVFTGGYPLDAPLPWAHLDKGVTTRFLQDEYRRALGQEVTPDCRDGQCNRCGLMGQPVCQQILKGEKAFRSGTLLPTPQAQASETAPLPHPAPQPEGRWVRLHYHRGEEVRWISHLDFIHVLERALRRAEWPLVYSEGFNPHPRISYGPPLPTGHISRAEYIDLMAAAEEIGSCVAALAAQLPAGIRIHEALLLPAKPRALADEIVRAVCRVTWPTLAGPLDLTARISALLEQKELLVTRYKEKEAPRILDIRPFLLELAWQEGALQIVSHVDHGKTVRMEEIISLLFPDEPNRARLASIERVHLWMEREGEFISPLAVVESGIRV